MDQSTVAPNHGDSSAEQLSQLIGAFKSALKSGGQPRLEDWVIELDSSNDSLVFCELLIAEVLHRRSKGESPTSAEYVARFVQFREVIQGLFESGPLSKSTDPMWADPTIDIPRPNSSQVPAEWTAGVNVGRYVLLELLGRGGFGEVWKALDPQLTRHVAIKVPRKDRSYSLDTLQRCENEARLAASLQDPGFVPVYDCGYLDGGIYIVSELIDGETLSERMKREPLQTYEVVDIVIQVARALHRAHARSLFHRDIKPSNVMLTRQGRALLTDFGLAVTEQQQLTESPAILGTLAYMSPEQARGESHHVDGRSDIFSLGVIFYQLLTGRLPFKFLRPTEYVDQLINREIPPLRAINDSIPAELERICLKAVTKNVTDRYTTALDFADDLDRWRSGCHTGSVTPDIAPLVAARTRHIKLLVVAACGLLLGLVVWQTLPDILAVGQKQQPQVVAAAAPAVVPAVEQEGWESLFQELPVIVAWQAGFGQEPPTFNRKTNSYSVMSQTHTWMATANSHTANSIKLRADVEMANWHGNAGLFWDLHVDRDSGKRVAWAIVVKRFDTNSPVVTLQIVDLVLERGLGDRDTIREFNIVNQINAPLPKASSAHIEVAVNSAALRVQMDDFVWEPTASFENRFWLGAEPGFVGMLGNAGRATVRKFEGCLK